MIRALQTLALGILLAAGTGNHATPVETLSPGAIISFTHLAWDGGPVTEGDFVDHVFPFRNNGTDTLIIREVRPSCGCTLSKATSDRIAPGETAAIYAQVNTTGKQGRIVKSITVSTNAQENSEVTLLIKMDVRKLDTGEVSNRRVSRVMGSMDRVGSENIFDPACRSCHVDPARHRFGAALYDAACAMCHGSSVHPTVDSAVAITGSRYLVDKSPKYLWRRIARGTRNPMMPGFSTAHGGPLTPTQITSLVDYFRKIRNKVPVVALPKFE